MTKKLFLTSLLFVFTTLVNSQTVGSNKPATAQKPKRERVLTEKREIKTPTINYKNKQRELYNHWSIELNAGYNKPVAPFADGYFANEPNKIVNFGTLNHFNVGVRYMASNIFGLKVGVGYDKIANVSGTISPSFDVKLYTATFEGVLNLGRLARFETFTNRLTILSHFGLHTSYKSVDYRLGVIESSAKYEQDGGVVIGLTPEVRISNRISIVTDFSVFTNFKQHINWDGSKNMDRNLNGTIYNTTLGINIALGSKKQHADWYIVAPDEAVITDMTKRIVDLEEQLTDNDRDGVPDYRDLQKNTPNGLEVDQKGRFIDENKNGKPDQIEEKTVVANNDNDKVINSNVASNFPADVTTHLIEKGYFNIFYDINRDEPNDASSDNIYQIIKFLKSNPTAKVKLVGHADKTGDAFANKELSERRAKSLYNIIKASGVDESRIKLEGLGVDKDVPSEYKAGNNIARRVTVIIEQ